MNKVIVPRGAVELAISQAGKFVKPQAEPRLIKQFKPIKEQMLSEFNNHPVTQELEGKISSVPSAFVSRGSLFGFIGFEKNHNPIQIVREMLEESELRFIRTNKGVVDFKVFYPSEKELYAATPLPWASGRSWLKGIESGISGLGRYLHIDHSEYSRSGGGIQSEYAIRGARFKRTKYISKILNNFIKKINELSI